MGKRLLYREWERDLESTPIEEYKLGPTGNFVPWQVYYSDILPLFIDTTPDQYDHPKLRPNLFLLLIQGNVFDHNYRGVKQKQYYIRDSIANRARIREWASLLTPSHRRQWAKTQLITVTHVGAWGMVLDRLQNLQQKLSGHGWHILLDETSRLDICPYLKLGSLLDKGLLPMTLLQETLRLVAVRLYSFLANHHPSAGYYNGRYIRIVYNTSIVRLTLKGEPLQLIYSQPALRPGMAAIHYMKTKAKPNPTR